MDEKAIRGVPWTLVSYGTNKILTVGATVVLARLLVPSDFGVVALALVIMQIAGAFGTAGLGAALIIRPDFTARERGAVLTTILVFSFLISAVVAALAPLLATVFEKGEALLRKQLGALSAWHLVNIAIDYRLTNVDRDTLNRVPAADLIELIVRSVRQEIEHRHPA